MKEVLPTSARRVVFFEQDGALHGTRRSEPVGEAPSFRDYWQVVRKHQWKILACFAFAVITSGVIAFTTTPIYIANATLMIERKTPQVVKFQQVAEEGEAAACVAEQHDSLAGP